MADGCMVTRETYGEVSGGQVHKLVPREYISPRPKKESFPQTARRPAAGDFGVAHQRPIDALCLTLRRKTRIMLGSVERWPSG